MNLLIVQTAFAGDVILTLPLVEAVRRGLPEARIHFLCIPSTADLVTADERISQVIVYDKRGADRGLRGAGKIVHRLRAAEIELALVPHPSMRSALLARFSGASRRIGFSNNPGRWTFTDVVPFPQIGHQIEKHLALLGPMGMSAERLRPEIHANEDDQAAVDDFLAGAGLLPGVPLVALAPGSIWPTKRWPAERFAELAGMITQRMGATVLLVGGSVDRDLCAEIGGGLPLVISAAGALSLRQSALLLKQCLALVTNDSAPLHMGTAAKAPVVAVFGPTLPSFGFHPLGDNTRVAEVELPCRPCGKHGGPECPLGTLECMTNISAERVFGELQSVLTIDKARMTNG